MADELIDLFDENNNPLNKQAMKSQAHKKGFWHRAGHVWIYNSKKELLLQLRTKDKEMHPNEWDISAAGHIRAGETPIQGALREVQEELGLKIFETDLNFVATKKVESQFKNINNKEFYYIYTLQYNGPLSNLKLQKEEVEKIEFQPLYKIREELLKEPRYIQGKNKYVPHEEYWFEMLDIIENIKN